jgi:hypothetical protein
MNKRGNGFELGWQAIFGIVFALAIGAVMIFFITGAATTTLVQKQIIAKELCLIATGSKAGTEIMVEHAKEIIIEEKNNGFVVKSSSFDPGYSYNCYIKNASILKKDNETYIKIEQ